MNNITTSIVSVMLVISGILTELNLIRMFVRSRREDRCRGAGKKLTAERTRMARSHETIKLNSMHRFRGATSLLGWVTPSVALAQSAPSLPPPPPSPESQPTISTDRPSFSDGTGFMPIGRLQIETGYTFAFRDRDDVETQRHNGPEILARVGILEDRFELRLIASGYMWSRADGGTGFDSAAGWSDLSIGAKLKVAEQDGGLPRLAIGFQTTLGGGSDSASNQIAEPTLKLIWSYDFGRSLGGEWAGITLGGNANIAWPTTSGERFTQGQGSVYLSFPIANGLSGFAEYFVIGPNSKGTDAAHYTDVGGTYLLDDRTQLDARVGFGLNGEADNLFLGIGVSFLF